MTIPTIRVSATQDGNIEASCGLGIYSKQVTINRQTGDVISSNVKYDSDHFRWLIRAAREWKSI